MSELEKICELSFMQRGPSGIRLTPEGEILRRHATAIVDRVDEAEQALEALSRRSRPTQRVRLAIIPSLAANLTPRLIERVGGAEHGPTLSIVEARTRDIETYLTGGRVDMAVFLTPLSRIDAHHVANEELLLVRPAGSPPGAVTEEQLSSLRFVLPALGNPLRNFVEDTARHRGYSIDVVLEVDGPGSRFNSVVSRIGCTLLGAQSIPSDATPQEFCVSSMLPPLQRPIYVGRRRGLDPELGDRMEAIIVATLADLGLSQIATGTAMPDVVP
jgi:DNA-binding transcriptional LysR family regulator